MNLRGEPHSLRDPTRGIQAKRKAADKAEMAMQNKGAGIAAKSEQPGGTNTDFSRSRVSSSDLP